MSQQTITVASIDVFAALIAKFVQEGLTFEASDDKDGGFVIQLTGGF
jgi:hypothetical protein